MKTLVLPICLMSILCGLFSGCATSPEAKQRASVQPGAAPAKWESETLDKSPGENLLVAGLQAVGWAVNR